MKRLARYISVFLLLTCCAALAQVQIEGLITGRSGSSMTIKTATIPSQTVVLTPNTDVQEAQGKFHFRHKNLGLAALVPGLSVQVKGSYNAQNQLVADQVKFSSSAFNTAQDIQAGLAPTEAQVQANQQQIQQNVQQLKQEQQAVLKQQQQLQAQEAQIAANKAAIAAANKRFGELADYNILGEVTVYFANGQTTIDPKYNPELLKLAQQAKTITAYIIQVQGYASKVGSAALNQKLSRERADHVLNFLEQQGGIPLTNVLAPGAMGTSQQVAPDTSSEGQAENRRVVVRILQNKGIAGT